MTASALLQRLRIGVPTEVATKLRQVVQGSGDIAAVGTGPFQARHCGLRERERLGVFSGAAEFVGPVALCNRALR